MAASMKNTDDALILKIEYPFIKIVHDCLSKSFRSTKRYIEKEIIDQLNKVKSATNMEKLTDNMENFEANILNLKNKYSEYTDREEELLNTLEKRIKYLQHVEECYYEKNTQTEYYEKRLWRLIIEYMMREGYIESSQMLIDEMNLGDFADMDFFMEINKIVEQLRNKE